MPVPRARRVQVQNKLQLEAVTNQDLQQGEVDEGLVEKKIVRRLWAS